MLLFLLLPILPYLLLHLLPSTPVALPSAFPSRNAALILTAHPDDETMFFSPMIQTLVGERIDVYAACMSTGQARLLTREIARTRVCTMLIYLVCLSDPKGNAVGLGDTRRKELVTAYEILGIYSTDITLFDHL
jgi:LmbE family N-acetylglucosaminyl deacetylase